MKINLTGVERKVYTLWKAYISGEKREGILLVFVVWFSPFPSHAFPFWALYLYLVQYQVRVEWVCSSLHPARAVSTEQHWSLEWCIWGLHLNWHLKQDKVLFRWFHRHLYLISSVKNMHNKRLQGSSFSSMSLCSPPTTCALPVTVFSSWLLFAATLPAGCPSFSIHRFRIREEG